MAIIYPAEKLKKFKEELHRRKKMRTSIWSALQAIPKRHEAIMKSMTILEADEKFEKGREEENEKQIRFLERTLLESTEVSTVSAKLEKMKAKLATLQAAVEKEERELNS